MKCGRRVVRARMPLALGFVTALATVGSVDGDPALTPGGVQFVRDE